MMHEAMIKANLITTNPKKFPNSRVAESKSVKYVEIAKAKFKSSEAKTTPNIARIIRKKINIKILNSYLACGMIENSIPLCVD